MSEHRDEQSHYEAIKQTINYDDDRRLVTIGERVFPVVDTRDPALGSKKATYWLAGEPRRVLKTARTDTQNDRAIFKAMDQSIAGEAILRELAIPHPQILDKDSEGPPYRYYIQEAVHEGSRSAADLIKENALTETDIAQLASYINRSELEKEWQIDTNPFNWYRVPKEDGTTEMTYVDGKAYPYEKAWKFRRVGLLQWTTPDYVLSASNRSAAIPRERQYEELRDRWEADTSELSSWWKKYLDPSLQPGK